MSLKYRRIGVAMTGSYCTFSNAFAEIEHLVKEGADVQIILSEHVQETDSRFGTAAEFQIKAAELTGHHPWISIVEAETIGPKALFDVLIILPCTGNTMAKLANGITDGPVTMAAKAHLRNERPLVLSLASNDALGMNLKNIGTLLNTKHIYLVPFGQDSPVKKPNSMIAHTELLLQTVEAALEERQIQPLVISPFV